MAVVRTDAPALERIAEQASQEILSTRMPNKLLSGTKDGDIGLHTFRVVGSFEDRNICATFDYSDPGEGDENIQLLMDAAVKALDRHAWPDLPLEEGTTTEIVLKATQDGRMVAAALVIAKNGSGEELIILFHSPFISPGTAVAVLQNCLNPNWAQGSQSSN